MGENNKMFLMFLKVCFVTVETLQILLQFSYFTEVNLILAYIYIIINIV